jgi:hypothetical protein
LRPSDKMLRRSKEVGRWPNELCGEAGLSEDRRLQLPVCLVPRP